MPRRLLACLTSGLLAIASLSACGGSAGNGLASKSADQIVAAAVKAADSAKSVHVAGSLKRSGQAMALDVALQAGKGARGTISVAGLTFEFIELPGVFYIKANGQFLRHFGNSSVSRLAGRWLRSPPTASGLSGLAGFTNLHQVFSSLLTNHGVLKKAGSTTFDGQTVLALRDTTKGGTLYVASTGTPYPVGVDNTTEGVLRLDRYNQPVSLTPPPNAIDLSKAGA